MEKKFVFRLMSCFLAVMLLVGILPINVLALGRTVYFDNTAQWSNVYIYYWSSANAGMISWPGEKMQPVEGDLYSFTLPDGVTMVIFNNGSGTQTADLELPDEENLYTYNSGWSVYEQGCAHVWDGGTITTAPTCTEAGTRTYTCTLCGENAFEPVAPSGHKMQGSVCTVCGATGITVYYENVNNWSTVRIYYWSDSDTNMTQWPGERMTPVNEPIYSFLLPEEAQYVIFNNGSTQTEDLTLPGSGWLYGSDGWVAYDVCTHSWDEGTVTPATCTGEGSVTYLCTLCGDSRSEVIPATGHSFENGKCTACGAVESCTEHVWDEGTVTQEATCWVPGTITYTCTLCGAESTQSITPGHKLYVAETIAPTCTATGKEITKCPNCAYVYSKTLPKIDHDYLPGEVVAPTCTEDGYTVGTCSGCGATKHIDPVYHTGHSWSGTTCTLCGLECQHSEVDGICVYCHKGGPAYVDGYYLIETPAQLYWFAAQVNGGNNLINGKLIADIDLKGGSWTSIGYYCSDTLEPDTVAYSGIFDGQGHTVSNFVTKGTDNEGLFGYCSSATIMNVGVIGATVTGWRAGAVAGYPLTSTVLNCFAISCTIIGSTTNSVAQLSGSVHIAPIASPQGGIVKNCYALNCQLIGQTDLEVNATPVGGTDTQNGYYCGIVFDGTFSSTRNSTLVTEDQLASGEVTYLLNKGVTDGTQGWYQTCSVGLPAHSGATVYSAVDCQGNFLGYANTPGGEHRYENGVCTVCGEKDPEESVTLPTISLKYPTLAFEDEILYNLYFTVDDLSGITQMGLLTFAERNHEGTVADALEVISGYVTNADGSFTAQSQGIPAKMLGDTMFFKVYAQLADGSYIYSEVVGYHAVAYANTVLGGESSDKAKALVVSMLNYGAAAQAYFNYKTDTLMNSGLTEEQQALVEAYSDAMVSAVTQPSESKMGSFVNNGGYTDIHPTVSFEGAFSINYYFTPKYTPAGGTVSFYYWDADTYRKLGVLTTGNATGMVKLSADSGTCIGTVADIAAKQIDQPFYVAAVYSFDGTAYYSNVIGYSLGAYCKNIAQNGNAFGAATAVYGYYAKAYFS